MGRSIRVRRARLPHAAPEERKRLNGVELGGREARGSGGARAGMHAGLLGECRMDGMGRGLRVGGTRAALCRASSIRKGEAGDRVELRGLT